MPVASGLSKTWTSFEDSGMKATYRSFESNKQLQSKVPLRQGRYWLAMIAHVPIGP